MLRRRGDMYRQKVDIGRAPTQAKRGGLLRALVFTEVEEYMLERNVICKYLFDLVFCEHLVSWPWGHSRADIYFKWTLESWYAIAMCSISISYSGSCATSKIVWW